MKSNERQKMEVETPFLLYTNANNQIKVDVLLQDETIWLNQKQMGELFGVDSDTISYHLKNIYKTEELIEPSTTEKISVVQKEGNRDVKRDVKFYNLDAIIAVGYRVNSKQATHFRIWATNVLKEYIIKGFALNDERFKSGNTMTYFDELQERLRDIRISEKFFYQKVKEIYKTSKDYDTNDTKTINFFKIVQNKLLWAVSSQTAAELVHSRVDMTLPLLGMTSLDKKSVRKQDVNIAKNYLNEDEIKLLGLLVEQYLAFAEAMAQQKKVMYMKDWILKLDDVISLNGRELLNHYGKISRKLADEKSELEYQKYKEQKKIQEKSKSFQELENDIKRLKS